MSSKPWSLPRRHMRDTSRHSTPPTTVSNILKSRQLCHLQTSLPLLRTPEITNTNDYRRTRERGWSVQPKSRRENFDPDRIPDECHHHHCHRLLSTGFHTRTRLRTLCPYTPPWYQDPILHHFHDYKTHVLEDHDVTIPTHSMSTSISSVP